MTRIAAIIQKNRPELHASAVIIIVCEKSELQGDSSDASPIKGTVGAQSPIPGKDVLRNAETSFVYSICTLVTDFAEYREMCQTFLQSGFGEYDCEYLFIDNTLGNKLDGFAGLNFFLNNARGQFIILCHQDVRVIYDDRTKMDAIIGNLSQTDPSWGVFGNCGGIRPGRCAIRITDPHGADQKEGRLPAKVTSLDENFIVARRDANLAVSRDLSGFHLYGTDLCLIADILGWSAYVVDFHLQHLSIGVKGATFAPLREQMIGRYRHKLSDRLVKTPSTIMYLSSSSARSGIMNVHKLTRLFELVGKIWCRTARTG